MEDVVRRKKGWLDTCDIRPYLGLVSQCVARRLWIYLSSGPSPCENLASPCSFAPRNTLLRIPLFWITTLIAPLPTEIFAEIFLLLIRTVRQGVAGLWCLRTTQLNKRAQGTDPWKHCICGCVQRIEITLDLTYNALYQFYNKENGHSTIDTSTDSIKFKRHLTTTTRNAKIPQSSRTRSERGIKAKKGKSPT